MKRGAQLKYETGGKKFSCLFAAIDANQKYDLAISVHFFQLGFKFFVEKSSLIF